MIEYNNNKYYLAIEVAEIMKSSVVAVRKLIKDKQLNAVKIGKQFYIADFELDKYFQKVFSGTPTRKPFTKEVKNA